jgi:hypothetical protein
MYFIIIMSLHDVLNLNNDAINYHVEKLINMNEYKILTDTELVVLGYKWSNASWQPHNINIIKQCIINTVLNKFRRCIIIPHVDYKIKLLYKSSIYNKIIVAFYTSTQPYIMIQTNTIYIRS